MADASTNLISPTSSAAAAGNLAAGQSNLKLGYDTFLKLLTTQLQHQDPTSPLDTNQFTSQLVQMTGVQQQLLSNELLQSLVNQGSGGAGVSAATGLIGKTVHAATGTATLSGGQVGWSYDLGAGAASATLTVKNAAGSVVWTGPAPSAAAGRNSFTWDGRSSTGAQLADGGSYTLSVAAQTASGSAVTATPGISGVAGSVQVVGGQTMVNIGKTQAPFSSIDQVGG